MATADRVVSPDRDWTAAKQPSKTCLIKSLRQELQNKQQVCSMLKQENSVLRTREEVLLQQVTQQGDNLHFVALAAAQAQSAMSADMPDMTKTLMQDMEVHVLLSMLGKSESSGEDEPLTTQWLRAAVTPERVAAMREMELEEVVATLKQLTMRMCMLLVGGSDKAHLFNESIEAVVNEYGGFAMLLHVAADRVNHKIGTLNLDTLEQQEPPPGYWESVVDSIGLDQQQMQTLTTGFNSYQQKSKPVIAALHAAVSRIRSILEASEAAESTQSQVASSTAGTDVQDQQLGDCGEVQQPGYGGSVVSMEPLLPPQQQQQAGEDEQPLQQLWQEWQQRPDQQQQAKRGMQQQGQPAAQAMQQQQQPKQGIQPPRHQHHKQQREKLLQELLQQGTSLAGWDDTGSHLGGVSTPMPWQQFGLSHGCLSIETAEVLEGHMTELMQHVMKLREMHRTVTWLYLNVLSHKQHVLGITAAWPWWLQPLPMCQYIAEKHEQQQKPTQKRVSRRAPVRFEDYEGPNAAAVAGAVADDIWCPQQTSQAITGPAQLRGSTLT